MLKEIYCEKFIEDGAIRPKIKFHKGLNTIVGIGEHGEKSENSVGKSTLLMIIDFCFGGKAFLKSKAVQIIKNHTICFAFEFDGTPHYFMRTTEREDSIFKCDADYQNPQNYTIAEFKDWLKEQYKLKDNEASFREIFDTYSRFYGDEKEISPKEILRTYNGHNGTDQVRTLEKLFEKYPLIKEAVDSIQDSENLKKVKSAATKLKVDISDFRKIDVEATNEKLAELSAQKEELLQKKKDHIPELDAQKAKELAELKIQHKALASRRSRLLTRIENIKNANFETVKPSKASYDALLEFFPNVDIKKIEEIDSFHEKLNNILAEEHEEALQEYKMELETVQTEIEKIEKQISDFGSEEDFTTAFLLEFSKIQSEIDRLNDLLKQDSDKKTVAAKVAVARKNLKNDEKYILEDIEKSINEKLSVFSENILGKDIEVIQFHFPTNASYELGSSLDDGTGTDYTSLILFDLSVLNLTKLPAIIHDSYLISNIRGNRLENLIKAYASESEKQIFLSIDETDKLNSDTETLVNRDNIRVIKLWQGGGELYGYYWGKKSGSDSGK